MPICFTAAGQRDRVAIIGAGGIGIDVASYLAHHEGENESAEEFLRAWGVDLDYEKRGAHGEVNIDPSERTIYLLKRSAGKHGKGLGKTTGWIHRLYLKYKNIRMLAGVDYKKIDDQGLHISVNGEEKVLEVDSIVVCAGQVENNTLYEELKDLHSSVHLVGGAKKALELDAKRAISEASYLAAEI